ncbi:type IV secretion system DNA-binding domain-containing protein [Candidatus Giovannonibacteria bacterium]|nr:type IV secretion system DNA-binding domain-containing protein [Candidatus Giovannonibacteria bacterium]
MNDDQKITYFGEANFRNTKSRFGIKNIDRRKHFYIVGKTGMGKTTLLENMAMQDIQSGEGMAFIDPHGETAFKLLDFVPPERKNDVIYFDPADTQFPIGFNIMESVDPERRHFVASGLMGVFKKIFGPDVWSARMEYILGNTVLALLEYPESTLLSINPMLAVKEYRKKVVENITDPVVKAFWTQEFAKYTERFAAEATPAIQNKVGQFTSNALIRNIVGQPKSTFDFRRAMDDKKIIIINLAKGRVGEDTARLLGGMIVTKLYLAAMSRVDIPSEADRKDFFIYVDEFQNFATESFADILSEARKYRLSLTLAHQFMAQLAEEVRDAVIGNVGTMVTFRVGAEDAEFLEKEFSPEFVANDIVNLGFAQVYVKLMIDGATSRPFSATTLPPIAISHESFKAEIIELSRKQFGTSREKVNEQIHAWSESIAAENGEKKIFSGEPLRQNENSLSSGNFSRPQTQLYDAICAICGKRTQVPFPPDPARPVFCKEHIGMAGEYKARIAERRPAVADHRPPRIPPQLSPREGEPAVREPQRNSEQRPVSLRELERRPTNRDARYSKPRFGPSRPPIGGQAVGQPFKKPDNLQALRDALKKSMQSANNQTPPAPSEKRNETEEVQEKNSSPASSNSKNGTIRPGERIEL